MKKKSPPYAIIGAAIFGILAIFLYIQHDNAQKAAAQAQIDIAARNTTGKLLLIP